MPLEYTGTPGCSVTLGTMPGRLELEDLKKTLAGAVEEAELICVSQEGESSFLLLFASRDRTEDALEALRPLGFSPVNLSGYRGTPEENISAIMDRLEGLEKDKGQIVQRIVQETVHRAGAAVGGGHPGDLHRPGRGRPAVPEYGKRLLPGGVDHRAGGGKAPAGPGPLLLRLGDGGPGPGAPGRGAYPAAEQPPDPAVRVVTGCTPCRPITAWIPTPS